MKERKLKKSQSKNKAQYVESLISHVAALTEDVADSSPKSAGDVLRLHFKSQIIPLIRKIAEDIPEAPLDEGLVDGLQQPNS